MNNQNEIASAFSQFGLDEIDTSLYLTLLKTGSVTVGNLSLKLEVDRGKTYRSLNKLRNLGMVQTTFANPTTCIAIKPDEALITILEKKENEIVTMKKIADEIIKNQDKLIHVESIPESSTLSIIQGRINIYTRIGKLIQDATDIVYMVTTLEDLMLMYHTAIPEKIKACLKKGVQLRLLTSVDSDELLPLVTRLGITEVRIGKLPSKGRMIVEKDKHIIMSGAMKESRNLNDETDSIMYTNSPDMVDNIYSLCTHLWAKSKPVDIMLKTNQNKVLS
ncbi:MAG: ArsR family transcriptional regulator [Thaumarchaeota archaeon]|nr:ArsR family transcriptional regulator [Nitrososphaerota archaeon]MBI3641155.1 ArsR family transcriptional regulator [Nitrososphaerota archaeon]